jgi:hypothetical protein
VPRTTPALERLEGRLLLDTVAVAGQHLYEDVLVTLYGADAPHGVCAFAGLTPRVVFARRGH